VTSVDYVAVAGLWLSYVAFAALGTWAVLRISRGQTAPFRRACVCLLLAVFFAPSVVGMGHGGGIGPAWMALFQVFPIKLGVVPILVTFVTFFGVSSAIAAVRGSKPIA
jgi:hypothetical protein